MDTNGEVPFFNKNNQQLNNYNNIVVENIINDPVKGISIADRRADFMNVSRLQITDDKFAVSPGISPSGLFDIDDSVIMLPNIQALPSPTTGCCSTLSNHHQNFNLTNGVSNDIAMEPIFEEFEQQRIVKTEEHKNMWEAEWLRAQAEPNCKMSNRDDEQKCLEDGYSWKKYGQKQVKGSEFPRSYYKCSNSNCEATKKVEGSEEGEISQIMYIGHHNHPPVRKVPDNNDHVKLENEAIGLIPDPPPQQLDHNEYQLSPQSNEADHDHDPKRRKYLGGGHETSAATGRSGREPKFSFQVETKIDILEDGFRWRKYGQKVVKGNPNPRSYYKCTTTDCGVRKHVERAAEDIKYVVTTYEGNHNHPVPSSRTNTNNISANNGTTPLINPTFSNSSTMSIPMSMPPTDNRVQKQLPLYSQKRKPFLNYTDFYKPNLATTTFGPPTIYPYSFSTSFNSLPSFVDASLMMNNINSSMINCLDSRSMSSVPLPPYNNHVLGSSSNVSDLDYNFLYNNYVLPVAPSDSNQGYVGN